MDLMRVAVAGSVYALVLNAVTFALFGWDKHCARNRLWRVPESTLLGFALVGGSIGAKLAQGFFRHKTHKQPFGTYLNAIIVLQICAIAALCVPSVRSAAWDLAREILGGG